MKFQLRNLILGIIIASWSLGSAQAAGTKVETLTDAEMASIKGGFCLIETCETGVPTGKCEDIPATMAGLCTNRTCRFIPVTIPLFGEIDVCTLFGQYTCNGPGGYRKCITGKLWDICTYSSINVCGTIVEPYCADNLEEKTCTCGVKTTNQPCDWTNCVP